MKKLFDVCMVLVVSCVVAACGGEPSLDLDEHDPRCVAACPETMPPEPGVGEVCDSASRAQCLDECEVRIAGLPSLCQSCLLEESYFAPPGRGIDSCDGNTNTCTIRTELGSCTFPYGDEAKERDCWKMVNPRRETTCKARWRGATECASVCPTT